MKTNALLICSLFAVTSLHGEQNDQQQQKAPNKPARVQQGQSHVAPAVHTQNQNPAFYRRSTASNPNWHPGIPNQTTTQNLNHVYTRGQVQHFNLSNTANPRISSTRFSAGARINGSDRWQGHNYAAFRSYHGAGSGTTTTGGGRITTASSCSAAVIIIGIAASGIRPGDTITPTRITRTTGRSTLTTIFLPIR